MAWKITVSPRHPRGRFRRDGREFTTIPTFLVELTPGLEAERKDPKKSYLVIEEMAEEQAQEALAQELLQAGQAETPAELSEDLEVKTIGELRDLAEKIGLSLPEKAKKKELVALLQGRLEAQ